MNPQRERLEEFEVDFVERDVAWCCAAAKYKDLSQLRSVFKQRENRIHWSWLVRATEIEMGEVWEIEGRESWRDVRKVDRVEGWSMLAKEVRREVDPGSVESGSKQL